MNWEQKIAINSQQKALRDGDLKDLAGEIIADKYKIIDVLGRGGSGIVFEVEQTFLGKHLALKLPTFNLFDGEESLRFQREAKATCLLQHPNLIKIFDFGLLPNKQPYLVMELVQGMSLSEYIRAHGPLSIEEATAVFAQAAAGLKNAHAHGIIHRDVKPGNIMLVSDMPLGAPGFVKILDFGIAKNNADIGQTLTQAGDIFGSPSYMSPEQCEGKKVDLRTDIYSLGCSFYEALVGTPPFVGGSYLKTLILHQTAPIPSLKENSLVGEFPPKLESIVQKMLQKNTADRYQNLDEFLADLQTKAPSKTLRVADEEYSAPTGRTPQKPTSRRSGRQTKVVADDASRSRAVVAIGFAATVLIGVAVFAFTQFQHGEAPAVKSVSVAETKPQEKRGTTYVNELDKITADQVDRDDSARVIFEKSPPIVSKIVTVNGQKKKAFMFPETAIGRISVMGRGNFPDGFSTDAVGTVYMPPNAELNLDIGRDYSGAFQYPAIYKKLGLNEFTSLTIAPPIALRFISREEKNIQVAEILQIASHWKNLRNLVLQTFKLNSAALDAIDNMKALTALSLINEAGSEAAISKRQFLQRVEGLLIHDSSINEFMPPLVQSVKLKSIAIIRPTACDDSSFKLLERFQRLESLHLSSFIITDSMFEVVSKCPQLSGVVIENCKLNRKQLEQLLRSKSLKIIALKHDYELDFAPSNVSDKRVKFLP